jgi:hypothetical protein
MTTIASTELERALEKENAQRLAVVCPAAVDELAAAERKAAEAAERAQAKRDAKNDAINSLIRMATVRARTLEHVAAVRKLAEIDLGVLGEQAAAAFIAEKQNPCVYSHSVYENAVTDLVRLSAMKPHFLKLIASIEADAAQQLEAIKASAKSEGISLPVLMEFLRDQSGLNEARNAHRNPEVLRLFCDGHFDDLK